MAKQEEGDIGAGKLAIDPTSDNFHKLALSESFERVAKVAEERQEFNEQMALNDRGAQVNTIEELRAANERWVIAFKQAEERAIEQHEAYKQEVSDAVEMISNTSVSDNVWRSWVECILEKFILPKPTVDPLIEALTKAGWGMPETNAKELRAALGAVGFKIVEVER